MGDPKTGSEEQTAEEKREEAKYLAFLKHEAGEFDMENEIKRILRAFQPNAYEVMDLLPGVPESDIKRAYRDKSLLVHPDKCAHPQAQVAFDKLKKANEVLLDEKARARLDEATADGRTLLIRERKLALDSEEVRAPSEEFIAAWREKIKYVLVDNEATRQRQLRAQMQEEGRARRKEDEELAERKRKRDHELEWERTRDQRIGNWRDFKKQKGGAAAAAGGGKEGDGKVSGASGNSGSGTAAAVANGGKKKTVKKLKVLG